MNKPHDQILIFPGETGWELWTRQGDSDFLLHQATNQSVAGELGDLPPGELVMAFGARSLTAVPIKVMTTDESLFGDLVALHAEQLGLKPDPQAGQLSEVFLAAREGDGSVVLSVFLKPPGDGGLPTRGPKAFDISARCLPADGNVLCLWREFGRWVFALHQGGRLWFCQATTIDTAEPCAALARELKLSLMQLSLQGLALRPARIEVWTGDGRADIAALAAEFDLPVTAKTRPVPVLPAAPSRLLPEDVRAARQAARRKRSLTMALAAVVALYLGFAGWLAFGFWQDHQDVEAMLREARESAPEGEAYALHMQKWRELADSIDTDHHPVELLYRIASCIPMQGGLRLEIADISAYGVTLKGSAPQLPTVKSFNKQLIKHKGLSRFEWETPEPNETTRGWEFRYTGRVPVVAPNP